MARNYDNLFKIILKQNFNEEIEYNLDKIEKIIQNDLPKSYLKNSYLRGNKSPIGRFLKENNIVAYVKPAKIVFKKLKGDD